jgi:beta-ribofuranosylaminobenzene 5'-phosphate synthase
MSAHGSTSVFVEAPARLHFGVLDLRGSLGRRFGGLGAAIADPSLLLEAAAGDEITAEGPDATRAAEYARRFVRHHGIAGGASLRVHRAIPAHAGLGSGTQLGLAVARALAELHGLPTEPAALARAVGRGQRSAIGTWAFALGGFILEGGRRPGTDGVAPLLARFPMPPEWRYVVAVPPGAPGLSGDAEVAAFERLAPPAEAEVERVAHLVLMQLLPAAADADLPAFGAALSSVQQITGGWFAGEQGGAFAPGPGRTLVRRMAEWGAAGVGQSSWGPAVYGVVGSSLEASRLADAVRETLTEGGAVFQGTFATVGARVSRSGPPGSDGTPD